MVNAAHIGHGGRSDHQAGHAEETSHRQLTRRERMFHFSDRAFDGCPVVLAFLLALPHFASPLGHGHLGGRKAQAEGGTLFPRLSRTALCEMKRTGLAEGRVEVRPVTTLATAQLNRHALSLGTGDVGGNALLILLDLEIGQVQLGGVQDSAIDAGLDLFDLMLPAGLDRPRDRHRGHRCRASPARCVSSSRARLPTAGCCRWCCWGLPALW